MDFSVTSVTMLASVSSTSNVTSNITNVVTGPQIWSLDHLLVTSIILGILIICTIIGNVFVIAAIILEKNLHCVANYLILSLAVSDCMVASIVMPISAVNEVTKQWFMSWEVCDMWISLDILCCTASILNLVAISIDRYWAVTNIDYIRKRTAKRIFIMVVIVWISAASISIPSILLFKDDNDPAKTGICIISQDHGYTIFSTVGAFYVPTIVLLIIYAKIFAVARKRILRKKFSKKMKNLEVQQNRRFSPQFHSSPEVALLPTTHHDFLASKSDISETPIDGGYGNEGLEHIDGTFRTIDQIYFTPPRMLSQPCDEIRNALKQKEKIKRQRERKAARTLAIITGSFIICWLPFFIIALSAPFMSPEVEIPRIVMSITLWLGYFNSLLNPFIYTMFNAEFRKAFRNIICRRCLRKRNISPKIDLWV